MSKMNFMLLFLILSPSLLADMGPVKKEDLDSIKNEIIHICDDGAEWPPYTFYKRENGKVSKELIGYSVDVIREIFQKHNIKFTLEITPWKRCQEAVSSGKHYSMFLSGSKNPDREKAYHISVPYYDSHTFYYWSKKHHPTGLDIKNSADFSKYRLGGVRGYGYSQLMNLNIDISKMDTGSGDLKAVVLKLHNGRIDVFSEDWEILLGLTAIGTYDFVNDKELGRASLPGSKTNSFYMMFTKARPLGLSLKNLLDVELSAMKESGRLNELMKPYESH